MRLKSIAGAALAWGVLAAGGGAPAVAQSAQAPEWRAVPPENLLVIDTSKGRVLIELYPDVAPAHVERMRTLAGQGFYDGHKFHRVLRGFMAQTGDPQGTGEGGSDLPDLPGEFTFRRGRDAGFARVQTHEPGVQGLVGALPVQTQPDAQMMVTADFKVDAHALFCPGVLGMARSSAPNSANSQFFIMTGRNDGLNAGYTAFGRVLDGLTAVEALKLGADDQDGQVQDPDLMIRARIASTLPEAQRPRARVRDARSGAFTAEVEAARARLGAGFTVCDATPKAEIEG